MSVKKKGVSPAGKQQLREIVAKQWATYKVQNTKRREKQRDGKEGDAGGGAKADVPGIVVAFDQAALERKAGAVATREGREYFSDRSRLKIEEISDAFAKVRVRAEEQYLVQFVGLAENEVEIYCGCLHENGDAQVICKHKIAAALALKEQYSPGPQKKPAPVAAVATAAAAPSPAKEPPAQPVKDIAPPPPPKSTLPPWREQLSWVLRKEILPQRRQLPEALLFFSFLQQEQGYVLLPGMIEADAVPKELWNNRAELADHLLGRLRDHSLRQRTHAIEPEHLNAHRWVNAAPGTETLLRLAVHRHHSSPQNSQLSQNVISLRDLAGALVFLGSDYQLIRDAVEVRLETAHVEMEIERDETSLRVVPVIALPDRAIPLASPNLKVFQKAPLWLMQGGEVFQADASADLIARLKSTPPIVIPAGAVDEFYQQEYEALLSAYSLRGIPPVEETIEAQSPQPRLYLIEAEGQLRARLCFAYQGMNCYAEKRPTAYSYVRDPEGDRPVRIERQPATEIEWWNRFASGEFGVRSANHQEGALQEMFVLRSKVHPIDFLKNYVPKLAAAGVEVYGEGDLTIGRINRSQPVISFSVNSGIDWFDLKAAVHFGDLEVPLADIRKAMRKDERFIKLADGSIGEIPAEWIEKYRHLFGLSEVGENGLRLARHHAALLDQLLEEKDAVTFDKQYEQVRAWLKDFQAIESRSVPKGFCGELRPYQKAGYEWLHFLRNARFGGCLADDMGTGKTIQTLCFLQSIKEAYEERNQRKRKKEPRAAHLLVLPRSLVINWEREAQKFTPDLKLLNFSQPERAADVRAFDEYDVVITTYGILLREIERLQEYEFDTVILDEAQAIKNPVSESAKAARLLKCRHRLTLTGTPVENNTLELWSQFAFLNPGLLGSIEYFRDGFTGPIERENSEQAVKTLRKLVYPFILRRTKDQVAPDLPPRSEKILWNEMEPDQRKLYVQTRDEFRAKILKTIEEKGINDARFGVLEGLLRLRQICNHPRLIKQAYKGGAAKLDSLLETLETLQAEGHKALIFSQFVQMLQIIERELKKTKIPYTYLDGSTTNRQARVDAFQNDDNIRVFLISLKAGGVGLNLTAADYVIHVDPWWNPAVEMQATDRAHRIGQDKPVFVYKLMMRDTVEEKILQLQERKRTLVKQLISTEAGFFKSLTADDIQSLFS